MAQRFGGRGGRGFKLALAGGVKPALTELKMSEPALFFVGVFVLPYVVGAALFPFLLLFFYLKEKLYDA